ncbi:MAG: DUF72 domain-containing protein [Nitrospiraceae bacterium]|nr:DUF72 domain-containing protein [Nitrospiraceae bacterium]MDA8089754.1 DUF72 domain-containing protein [Nitrospiraceae bacterium]
MTARKITPVHIGCSGFSYDHWKGVFYPEGLPRSKWLGYYCEKFRTVELNVTFYRLPRESTFRKWHDETPGNFLASVKGSRFITHVKKLKDPSLPLKRFFERIEPLRDKIGAVLWQLPPAFKADAGRLVDFLRELKPYKAKNAFEFRNESWVRDETVLEALAESGCALCMADWPEFLRELPLTAGFVYIRRHGHGTYGGSYTSEELREDARRINNYIDGGREVFIYFNNDAQGYAPKNALELGQIMSGKKKKKKENKKTLAGVR